MPRDANLGRGIANYIVIRVTSQSEHLDRNIGPDYQETCTCMCFSFIPHGYWALDLMVHWKHTEVMHRVHDKTSVATRYSRARGATRAPHRGKLTKMHFLSSNYFSFVDNFTQVPNQHKFNFKLTFLFSLILLIFKRRRKFAPFVIENVVVRKVRLCFCCCALRAESAHLRPCGTQYCLTRIMLRASAQRLNQNHHVLICLGKCAHVLFFCCIRCRAITGPIRIHILTRTQSPRPGFWQASEQLHHVGDFALGVRRKNVFSANLLTSHTIRLPPSPFLEFSVSSVCIIDVYSSSFECDFICLERGSLWFMYNGSGFFCCVYIFIDLVYRRGRSRQMQILFCCWAIIIRTQNKYKC